MEQTATLTRTLQPLVWAKDKSHLVPDIRTTLEKGTPVTIGRPQDIRYNHGMEWFVPVIVDGEEQYFLPQNSIILE